MTKHHIQRTIVAGFTLSEEAFDQLSENSPILLTQTQTFGKNLLKAFQTITDEVQLLSFAPAPNFPEYPQVLFRTSTFEREHSKGTQLGFINLILAKHLSRDCSLRLSGRRILQSFQPSLLVVHGVHSPWLKFARRMKKLHGIEVVAVLTDPPGVVRSSDGLITRLLKRWDLEKVKRELQEFDYVVSLTNDLAADFAPNVPVLVFPGFAPDIEDQTRKVSCSDTFNIAYAGGLAAEYGVSDLVEAFRKLPFPNARLHIYGKGDLTEWIISQSKTDKRINFHGAMPLSELHPELLRADLLVNPRRLDGVAVRHSFPSKLLEYMALGVPTLSTPLAPLVPPFSDHLILTEEGGVESIRVGLLQCYELGTHKLAKIGRDASLYVRNEYSAQEVGTKIAQFIAEHRT